MAKKTQANKPAPPQPTVKLDSRLTDELDALKKVTSKAVKITGEGDNAVFNVADIDASINALTLTRALVKDTDAEKKQALNKAIPEAVAVTIKSIETEAKQVKSGAEALEAQLAKAINTEIAAKRITESMTSARGCQLILQRRKELVIDDVTALPDEYTKKVADTAKIEEALKEWQIKVDACATLKLPPPPCPVPGAHIGEKIVLVTKAPELIEE